MTQPKYGFDRRGFLRMGIAGVTGSTLPISIARSENADNATQTGKGKAKSVLLVLLSGGPSQLDTVDPKPEAPAEIRGEFGTIGANICQEWRSKPTNGLWFGRWRTKNIIICSQPTLH